MKCLLVGKGPSAKNARRHKFGVNAVATINDAGSLIEGPIDYCFFTDVELCRPIHEHASRVVRFVCPTHLHRGCRRSWEDLPPWLNDHAVSRYPYKTVAPSRFRNSVRHHRVCLYCTATAAMSWLAYAGFTHLQLIGFDGGVGVQPGTHPSLIDGFNYDVYRKAQEHLADVLTSEMGVTTEWLS